MGSTCLQAAEPVSRDCGSLCALAPVLHSSRGRHHEKAAPVIREASSPQLEKAGRSIYVRVYNVMHSSESVCQNSLLSKSPIGGRGGGREPMRRV